jgi:hypothetical protein
MRETVLLMLLCYLAGIVVGNLVFIPYLGPVVIFTIVVGWLAGLPELVVAILFFSYSDAR